MHRLQATQPAEAAQLKLQLHLLLQQQYRQQAHLAVAQQREQELLKIIDIHQHVVRFWQACLSLSSSRNALHPCIYVNMHVHVQPPMSPPVQLHDDSHLRQQLHHTQLQKQQVQAKLQEVQAHLQHLSIVNQQLQDALEAAKLNPQRAAQDAELAAMLEEINASKQKLQRRAGELQAQNEKLMGSMEQQQQQLKQKEQQLQQAQQALAEQSAASQPHHDGVSIVNIETLVEKLKPKPRNTATSVSPVESVAGSALQLAKLQTPVTGRKYSFDWSVKAGTTGDGKQAPLVIHAVKQGERANRKELLDKVSTQGPCQSTLQYP
jgi:myosin heavy subunit